jgi:hypothetical protein
VGCAGNFIRARCVAPGSDRGKLKVIPAAELERYCETIAAM